MSLLNFLGPRFDDNGNPTGPKEYEDIVKERYYISKRSNTSYLDVGEISVHERKLLMKFIAEEVKQEQEFINKQQQQRNSKRG